MNVVVLFFLDINSTTLQNMKLYVHVNSLVQVILDFLIFARKTSRKRRRGSFE